MIATIGSVAAILGLAAWYWWVNTFPRITPVSTAWLEQHAYDRRQGRSD